MGRWCHEPGVARSILTRIGGREHADTELADIQQSVSVESASLSQLLQPGLRRVLFIGISLAVLQQITGINVFLYYAPEIFKSIVKGTGTNVALLQTVVVGAVNLLFTVVAVYTVDRLGRRPLMIIGSIGMFLALCGIGAAAYLQRTEGWVLTFILGYMACFALSVGPVVWVILSEIFPTKIRGRAMGIATICLWSANYVVSQTFPMMDGNATLVARFHHAFPFWLYGAFCVVMLVIVLRCVPETKGRSLEDIERRWLQPTRDSSERTVEPVSNP